MAYPFSGAAQVFRDFVTDGVPDSGAHQPVKSQVRSLLRALEARAGDVSLSVVEQAGETFTEQLQAAVDALPSTGGVVWLPEGTYELAGVTVANKPLALRGRGRGVTRLRYTGSGTAITVTQNAMHPVLLDSFSLDAWRDAGPCARAIDVVYPETYSFPRQTLIVHDVEMNSDDAATGPTWAKTWLNGIRAQYAWYPTFERVSFSGQGNSPVTSGSIGIELRDYCNGARINSYTCYGGTWGVYLSDYFEGVRLDGGCEIVGTRYGVGNPASGVTVPNARAGSGSTSTLFGQALYIDSSCHIAASEIAVDLHTVQDVFVIMPDLQKWAGSAAARWDGVKADTCTNIQVRGGGMAGPGTDKYGVSLTDCSRCIADGTVFNEMTRAVEFLGTCVQCTSDGTTSFVSGASVVNYFISAGSATTCRIIWARVNGEASFGSRVFANSDGNPLLRIMENATAVNFAEIEGAATGNAVVMRALGTDTNVDLVLEGKGTGLVGVGEYQAGSVTAGGYIELRDPATARVLRIPAFEVV